MSGKESLGEQLPVIESTLTQLRDIRRAVTLPQRKPLREIFTSGRYANNTYRRQYFMVEAEFLATAAGDSLAATAIHSEEEKILREKWMDTLSDFISSYKNIKPLNASVTNTQEMGFWVLDHVLNIEADPTYVQWDMFSYNNLGAQTIEELIVKQTAVVSPLSTDYLIATIYRGFYEQTQGEGFKLFPVALGVDKGRNVLSAGALLEDSKELAIYLDGVGQGLTGQDLEAFLKGIFPGKIVHSPTTLQPEEVVPTFDWVSFPRPGENS